MSLFWPESSLVPVAFSRMSSKRRRTLSELVGLKGVTASALEAITKKTAHSPDEIVSSSSSYRFLNSEFDPLLTTIKLPLKNGDLFDWYISSPSATLQYFATTSVKIRMLLQRAIPRPDATINIILYADEVTPGSLLRPDNQRKFMAWYWSVVEFGRDGLCDSDCWFPLGRRSSCQQGRSYFCLGVEIRFNWIWVDGCSWN